MGPSRPGRSSLIPLAATRTFTDTRWAWLKSLLDLVVFEAALVIIGSIHRDLECTPSASDDGVRAARDVLTMVNVVLAVRRPRLDYPVC
jgi:hypothetical protein